MYLLYTYIMERKIVIFRTGIFHNIKFLINPNVMYLIHFLNKKVIRGDVFELVVHNPYN